MISEFDGDYCFLSNFFLVDIEIDRITYPSVEHAYMAGKSDDPNWKIRCADKRLQGRQIKQLGQNVKLKSDWSEFKVPHMKRCLEKKFAKQPLKSWLLETGEEELQEGNYWGDIFWGVSTVTKYFKKRDKFVFKGEGENNLGKLLMEIRQELNQ